MGTSLQLTQQTKLRAHRLPLRRPRRAFADLVLEKQSPFDSASMFSSLKVVLPRSHYDCAVLAHSLWYFASMDLLQRTLKRMKELADRLYLSEWDLTPTRKSQLPHFAAALVQGWTSAWKPDRRCNIQTLMSRQAIERLVLDAGWTIETNVSVDSSDLQDGRWEVLNCLQILSSGIGRDDSTTIEGLDLDNVKILLQQSASEALPSFAMRCHQPQ